MGAWRPTEPGRPRPCQCDSTRAVWYTDPGDWHCAAQATAVDSGRIERPYSGRRGRRPYSVWAAQVAARANEPDTTRCAYPADRRRYDQTDQAGPDQRLSWDRKVH